MLRILFFSFLILVGLQSASAENNVTISQNLGRLCIASNSIPNHAIMVFNFVLTPQVIMILRQKVAIAETVTNAGH